MPADDDWLKSIASESTDKIRSPFDDGAAAVPAVKEPLPLNCPTCGEPLWFIPDPRPDVHVYACDRHGAFHFTKDSSALQSGTGVDGDDEAGSA